MTVAEVNKIRDGSAGYKAQGSASTWGTNYVEMGKKTAIRRISKFLPMNVQKAAAIADMYDSGRHARLDTFGDLEVEAPAGGDVIDATAVEEGASALDQFAGVTPPAAQSPAPVPGQAAPADPSGGPVLITPARAAELRAMAEKNGWDADEVCAELSGSGLESTPAGFEPTVLLVISKPAKTRKA
jgi:recombination protein RecT